MAIRMTSMMETATVKGQPLRLFLPMMQQIFYEDILY
jgi:hypothetical protein